MSLIGPRPDPLDDMDIYTEHQKKKLAVRPGITGCYEDNIKNEMQGNTISIDPSMLMKILLNRKRYYNSELGYSYFRM